MSYFFEDLYVGLVTPLGSHTFTAEEIIEFASEYDPQPFHLDAEAAKDSLFGALCASGWHTTAAWMKTVVETNKREIAKAVAAGYPPPVPGPSPGLEEINWLKPVFAEDTIRFESEVKTKRDLASKPKWGLITNHNRAFNEKNELVMEFTGKVFWPKRGNIAPRPKA